MKVLAKRLQFKLFMHLTFSKHIEVVVFLASQKYEFIRKHHQQKLFHQDIYTGKSVTLTLI